MAKNTYKKRLSQEQVMLAVAEYVQRNPPKDLPFASWQVSVVLTLNTSAKRGKQITSTVTLKMNKEK